MSSKKYILEFNVAIRDPERGYEGLTVANRYTMEAADLLTVMKILAELEAYCKKLVEVKP